MRDWRCSQRMPDGKARRGCLNDYLPPNGTKAVTDEIMAVAARAHASDRDMVAGWLSLLMPKL